MHKLNTLGKFRGKIKMSLRANPTVKLATRETRLSTGQWASASADQGTKVLPINGGNEVTVVKRGSSTLFTTFAK